MREEVPGVATPPSINPHFRRTRRNEWDAATLVQGIVAGDRAALAQAITRLESTLPEHQRVAADVVDACLARGDVAARVGISGPPGVGKSTLIEALGMVWIAMGAKVAVLAVDPSSSRTRGSILGDKSRMASLSTHPSAFVRPSPNGESPGGVAATSREAIFLCEAAGFDHVVIETVGVGQSDSAVYQMVDCFLLLAQPGAGDELQGIKRGVMEVADLVAVTKADLGDVARRTQLEVQSALRLSGRGAVPVLATSSADSASVRILAEELEGFVAQERCSGSTALRRADQAAKWLRDQVRRRVWDERWSAPGFRSRVESAERDVRSGRASVRSALRALFSSEFAP